MAGRVGTSSTPPAHAAATAGACAGVILSGAAMWQLLRKRRSHSSKQNLSQREGAATQAAYFEKSGRIDELSSSSDDSTPRSSFPSTEESDVGSDVDSNEDANYDMSGEDDAICADGGSSNTKPTTGRSGSGKLWSRKEFPEGTSGAHVCMLAWMLFWLH